MFLNLFTKDYRFFSLKEILKLSMGKPHKDLTYNFYLTIERLWVLSRNATPGQLTNKYAEIDPKKYNLFLTENMKEYENLNLYKKGLIIHHNNILYDTNGDPIVKLTPLSEFNNLKLEYFDNYSTVIIDKKAQDIFKNNSILNLIDKLKDTHSVISVDGVHLCSVVDYSVVD